MAFLLTFSGGGSATYKDAVRACKDAQLALAGATPLIVDGVTLVNNERVLLRGQAAPAENGIYVVVISGGNYTLTRAADANNSNDVLPNMLVPVSAGTLNADKIFQLVSPSAEPIAVGTDSLVFTDVLIGLANKADRDLANLLPTAINQSLLFGDDTSYNIGAAGASRPQTLYVKTAINLNSLTASQILASDASKNITSLPVATYPSLTELSYVKGVTSALQTQLNAKVDSVSGSAPIASSGGTTPTISISDFGGANGVLAGSKGAVPAPAATDNTKYLKGDGTWATITLLPAYSQDKVLYSTASAAEWRTVGTGSTASSYPTGTTIFGVAKPSGLLNTGTYNSIVGNASGTGLTSGNYNTLLGHSAGGQTSAGFGTGVTTGIGNVLLGAYAGTQLGFTGTTVTSQSYGIGIGYGAMPYSNYSIAIGYGAFSSVSGLGDSHNIAIGTGAVSGSEVYGGVIDNIAIGRSANTGAATRTIAIGGFSNGGAYWTWGDGRDNVVIGYSAKARGLSEGVVIGKGAGNATLDGYYNTIVGSGSATAISTGASNTIVGHTSATALTTGSNNIVVGKGNLTANQTTTANNCIVGFECATSAANIGSNHVILGYQSGLNWNNRDTNVAIGYQTGNGATGDTGVFIGQYCGAGGTGSSSVAIGFRAAAGNNFTNWSDAICLGNHAGYQVGQGTVAIGPQVAAIGRSTQSVAIGQYALRNGTCDKSIGIGYYAGNNSASNNSIFLGPYAGQNCSTNNELYIANQNYANNTDEKTKSLIYGVFNATPTSQTLRINAQVNLVHGEKHASVHAQTGTANVITATVNNYYIGVDCSGAAKTVNLPAAATAGQGFVLVIKDESGSAATNNITLQASGAENIDGTNTKLIAANYGSYSLMCSGSAWFIM